MSDNNYSGQPACQLGWANVALGFSFIVFGAFLSSFFLLGVERTLISTAARCIVQLTVVAFYLQSLFATNQPWSVASIALLLNLIGAFEIVANKSDRRHQHMFLSTFIGMLGSTIPISVISLRFALSIHPFWKPIQFIPILGLLCGNSVSGIVVSLDYVLRELQEDGDKVEMYLAFGASRFEACKPIVREALRLAIIPVMNQLSVIGLISIPGMMSGAILEGTSIEQAARLQMIISFMVSSTTILASFYAIIGAMAVCIDTEHRIRPDRIVDQHTYKLGRALINQAVSSLRHIFMKLRHRLARESGVEGHALLLLHARDTGLCDGLGIT